MMEKVNSPIRVLQVNAGSKDFGGVSSFLYNVYLHIDRSKVQFDFLSPSFTTYGIVKDEILSMGGRVFELGITGNKLTRKIRLYFKMLNFLKKEHYAIIHINSGGFFFDLIVVKAAERAGVKTRIVHSHSAGALQGNRIKRKVIQWLKQSLEAPATDLLACSKLAAQSIFTEESCMNGRVKYISNGIDVSRFRFRPDIRESLRREMGLENKFVIGHVGRFSEEKNHDFLIDVFSEVHRQEPSAVLLLIGEGPLEGKVKETVDHDNLSDCVYFLGARKEVEKLYQVMDYFVLPSVYEGLGIVTIEAQAAGLRVLCSDSIPLETQITDKIEYMSLNTSSIEWAEKILLECSNKSERKNNMEAIIKSGYSIIDTATQMENLYLKAVGK